MFLLNIFESQRSIQKFILFYDSYPKIVLSLSELLFELSKAGSLLKIVFKHPIDIKFPNLVQSGGNRQTMLTGFERLDTFL